MSETSRARAANIILGAILNFIVLKLLVATGITKYLMLDRFEEKD
jgi:hypothetical protein